MKNFLRAVASIVLLALVFSAHADWTKLNEDFRRISNHEQAVSRLEESEKASEQDLYDLIAVYHSAISKKDKDSAFESIGQFLSASALTEKFKVSPGADAKAKEIKKNPIYKAEKEVIASNWIQKLFERLKNAFNNDSKEESKPSSPPPGWVFPLIQGLFIVFCIAIIALLVFLLTKIPWGWTSAGRAKRVKRGGMLETGEELLTEDEYLLEADRLVAEGKYREACRALYLASLLRIDKSRIARFESTQTNWEHLRRIETSRTRPELLQFRPVTKAFDHVWYGYRVRSADDVAIFRETYVSIKVLTEGMA
jgi:hypothetical protein